MFFIIDENNKFYYINKNGLKELNKNKT